jgi:hypothetical protein
MGVHFRLRINLCTSPHLEVGWAGKEPGLEKSHVVILERLPIPRVAEWRQEEVVSFALENILVRPWVQERERRERMREEGRKRTGMIPCLSRSRT